ncbi:hypothetical protein C8J57DRAFT_1518405 [Mycena rebaudengoi]|nr:hypothetical protein C8J57DRAFT_1518405 [Mycena rebaudengoi]
MNGVKRSLENGDKSADLGTPRQSLCLGAQGTQCYSPPVPISSFRIPHYAFGVERAALIPCLPSPLLAGRYSRPSLTWRGLAVHLRARGARRLGREERGFERSELGARDSAFDTLLGPLSLSVLRLSGWVARASVDVYATGVAVILANSREPVNVDVVVAYRYQSTPSSPWPQTRNLWTSLHHEKPTAPDINLALGTPAPSRPARSQRA